jgi:hypothetical protein
MGLQSLGTYLKRLMDNDEEIEDTQEYVAEEEPEQEPKETLTLSVSQTAEAEVDAEE